MARMAVGDFNAMLAIGIRNVVTASRMDVVHRPTDEMLDYLRDCLPRLIVLDASDPGTAEAIRRIVAEYPSIQVVTCSAEDPTLRVYPPFHHGESFETSLSDLPLDG